MAQILIIDDDPSFRRTLKKMLEFANYKVFDAANGKEGIELFEINQIDLVITDIFMPKQDGVETIQTLSHNYNAPKIIAISGGGDNGEYMYLDHVKTLGITETFTKPFHMDDFLKSVERILAT